MPPAPDTDSAASAGDVDLANTAEIPVLAHSSVKKSTPAERRRSFAQVALAAGVGDDVGALTTLKRKNRFTLEGVSLRWVITMLLFITAIVLTVLFVRKVSVANSSPTTELTDMGVQTAAPQAEPAAEPADTAAIVVHVSGAVAKPGVVELRSGDRVADAIELAGGMTSNADIDRINLAAEVTDGDHIHVLEIDEAANADGDISGTSSADGAGSGLVNVNKASAAQLETVPGIGPVTAQAIVQWREENGKFSAIEQLVEIPGIGAKTLERLRPYLTV